MKSFWILFFLVGSMGLAAGQNIDSLINPMGELSASQRDSLRIAILEMLSAKELAEIDRLQDSLFGENGRRFLAIPPDREKSSLLVKSVKELPGISVHLPLPSDWQDIDPFANQSMAPRHLKQHQGPVPEYMRFTVGMTGYYFAFQEAGFYGYSPTSALSDSLGTQIHIAFPEGSKIWTPKVLKIMGLSKTTLVILAVVLQALLL